MISRVSARQFGLGRWAAAAGFLAVSLGNIAHATVLWYDGFTTTDAGGDYTIGVPVGMNPNPDGDPLTMDAQAGQSGGTGTFFATDPVSMTPPNLWIQPGGDNQFVLPDSLTKPGLIHPSIGGSLGDNDAPACCITGRNARLFSQPWSGRNAPEGTFYMGYLVNYGEVVGGVMGDVHHRTLEMWDAGYDDTANRNLMLGYSTFAGLGTQLALMAKDSTSGQAVVKQLSEHLEFVDDGNTHYMVMKFELSNTAGADRVSVFLDPMGITEPGTPSAVLSGADYTSGGLDLLLDRMGGIVQFSFFGGNLDISARMDELRIGTEFADVAGMIPEPASCGLAGLCVVGLMALARRKAA